MTTTMETINSPRERELRGHGTRRYQLPMHGDCSPRLCECGCGQPTRLAPYTATAKGWVKGKPLRFVHHHSTRGIQSLNWRDGRKLLQGREMTYVGLGHPMAPTQRYVMTHRLVMAEALGRPLLRSEHVHHMNLDHTDNRVENLVVLTASQHKRLHVLVDRGTRPIEALGMVLAA